MRYSTRIGFTITSGVPVGNVFSGNSVFDPDVTGGGHQAYGYDQLATYYQSYLVVASSCRVVMMPQTSTSLATQTLIFGLQASNTSSLNLSDIAMWTETGDGCYGITNSNGFGAPGKGASPVLSMKRSSAKMIGQTDIQANTDPNNTGTIGANPNVRWYWKLYVNTADGLTTSSALADVSLTYHTLWNWRVGSLASS